MGGALRRAAVVILLCVLASFGLVSLYLYKQGQLDRGGVPILRFHRVTPERYGSLREPVWLFDLQLRYLKWRGYRSASLQDLVDHKLPPHPVIITFDDGYEDNYYYVAPILRKYHFSATIFIITEDVGGINRWDVQAGRNRLKMMSWFQIRSLQRQGITIGSHTLTHPYLTSVNRGTARKEIVESKRILEEKLGRPVRFFAYPYGDVNPSIEKMVKKAGYQAAVSVHEGVNERAQDPYNLYRIRIQGGDDFAGWRDFFWFVWSF